MDPFELELKQRLRLREPSVEFAARVMGRLRAATRPAEPSRARAFWNWRWAAAGALAASLSVAVVVEHGRHGERKAQRAAAELEETLFFTGAKMEQVRDAVWGAPNEVEK